MAESIAVRLTAETGDLQAGLSRAVSGVRSSVGAISSSLQALDVAVKSVFAPLAALGALLAAGNGLRQAVDATVEYTTRAVDLGRQLGITATEAGVLDTALGDVYVTAESFSALSGQLLRQLRANEQGFAALGVQTRNANGEYLSVTQIFTNATTALNGLREGTDRNIAAQTLFGRGAGELGNALRLNNVVLDEARRKQESLGLLLSGPQLAAVQRYRAALNDVGDVVQGVANRVGQQLLPALTQLGEFVARIGPALVDLTGRGFAVLGEAIGIVTDIIGGLVTIVRNGMAVALGSDLPAAGNLARGALNGLLVVLQLIRAGIGLLINVIGAFVNITLAELRQWAEIAAAALRLDFNGVAAAYTAGTTRIEKIIADSRQRIAASASQFGEIGQPEVRPSGGTAPAAPPTGGRSFGGLGAGSAGLDLPPVNVPKIEPLELIAPEAISRLQDSADLLEELRAASIAGSLASVDAQSQAAEQRYQLGILSKQQLLALDQQYEAERLAIQQSALQSRLALLESDPSSSPAAAAAVRGQLQQLELDHQATLTEIQNQAQLERTEIARNAVDQVSELIGSSISRLVTLQASFAETVRALWTGLLGTITQALTQLIAKYIAQRLAALLFERATKTVSAAGQITANAGVAASGAYAATALIPYVGPYLAPAAAATAFAGAISFLPLASAARGFDIPAGINPVTQLHQREMVLPAAQADVIRDLADGGGAGGITINVSATDGASVQRMLMDNREALVGAIRSAVNDGIRR